MKKYLASSWGTEIEEVEVERETEKSVWVKTPLGTRRYQKQSASEVYHDTRAAANAWLLEKAEERVAFAERRAVYVADVLKKARADLERMKEANR